MRIRSHLMLFVVLSVLPLLAFSAVMTVVFWRQHGAALERGFLEGVRGMAIALDREHGGIIQTLRVIAHSVYLDAADLRGFERQAGRILAEESSWADLVVTDPAGRVLLDLRRAPDGSVTTVGAGAPLPRVVPTLEPVISNLERLSDSGRYVTSVGVPVIFRGRLKYALFAVIDQAFWLKLMAAYPMPSRATMTLLGRDHVIIARTLNPDRWIGRPPSPGLREKAEQMSEGAYRNVGLEGQWFYTAHSRAGVSGWTIASGVPIADVEASLWQVAATLAGGAAVALLLAVGVAFVWGRRIARPVSALAGAAASLGRGQPPPARGHGSHIVEVEDVAAALEGAGAMIREREAERTALLAREQAARADAEAASRAKDEFLAVLSHELRTPINAVYGWARMLQRGQVDVAELPRAIDVIVRNSNAQVQLIDDLLDVSRIVTGKLRLDIRRADLLAVVEAAVDAVRPAAEAKGVRLESRLDQRTGPISGDPARLQQVVWNLLINSVKFTPKGGRIEIQVRRVEATVEIVVSDTGQGIAPEMLGRIFERFTQGEVGSTRAHGGLGLGLALVRHLVELHGGTVSVASPGPGQGATFTVKLPMATRVEDAPAARPGGVLAPPQPAALSGLRLLIVDDDLDALDLASAVLSAAGAEVHTAASAGEAFSVFEQWRPDVLLSDIEMPEEDGYSLIRKLRARGRTEGGRTPAVALTAYGRAEDRIRTLSAGFNMHLPKPVDPAELVAVVASLGGR